VAPPTERLYLEDARRKTALATVTGHAAGGFLLDKTLFHAADAGYHHAQPCDLGHVLAEGHKLKLDKVHWDRGRLVHKTSGPLPAVGAKAQLHLDAPRRDQQARAHAAMHLLVTAVAEGLGQFLAVPAVVGGGEVRLHARFREPPAAVLPRVVARAQQLVDAREPVSTLWAPRDEAARMLSHEVVALDAVAPGEPTLRLARTGTRSLLPCDAPLVQHTWEVGRLKLTLVQPRAEGVRFGVKVLDPA
jgi:Ser-tRNA(Ala) deacylase AlaX